MRKIFLATVAAASLLIAAPAAKAQFAVIDPANLAQNVLQVVESIEEGLRTLQQIELAVQTVTGSDFNISGQLTDRLNGVQNVLNNNASLVFEQTESLEQFRGEFPEAFAALDTLEGVVDTLRGQNERILGASQQAVESQSVSAEEIQNVRIDLENTLAESVLAVGPTAAIQAGNQLQGQIVTMLTQMQGTFLTQQRLDALEAANRAQRETAAEERLERFADSDEFANQQFEGVLPEGWSE